MPRGGPAMPLGPVHRGAVRRFVDHQAGHTIRRVLSGEAS